jgi:hypothetical protein
MLKLLLFTVVLLTNEIRALDHEVDLSGQIFSVLDGIIFPYHSISVDDFDEITPVEINLYRIDLDLIEKCDLRIIVSGINITYITTTGNSTFMFHFYNKNVIFAATIIGDTNIKLEYTYNSCAEFDMYVTLDAHRQRKIEELIHFIFHLLKNLMD